MTEPADLSDAELCAAVAEEVLGGRPLKGLPPWADRANYVKDGLKSLSLSWNGIGQVVEAMQERCFHHELITEPEIGHVSTFTFLGSGEVREGSGDPRDADDYIRNPARAVFEAALKAVRATDGDDA